MVSKKASRHLQVQV
jgi:hypothetical protein